MVEASIFPYTFLIDVLLSFSFPLIESSPWVSSIFKEKLGDVVEKPVSKNVNDNSSTAPKVDILNKLPSAT